VRVFQKFGEYTDDKSLQRDKHSFEFATGIAF